MNRRAIIIISVILVAFAAGILLFFISAMPIPSSVRPKFVPAGEESFLRIEIDDKGRSTITSKESALITPSGGEADEERAAGAEFFGLTIQLPQPVAEALKPISLLIPSLRVSTKEISEKDIGGQSAPTQFQIVPRGGLVSGKQFFDALYPPFYVAGIKDIQAQLAAEGIVVGETLATEADIKRVLFSATNFLADRGIISRDEFGEAEKELDIFFNRSDEEKRREVENVLAASAEQSSIQFNFPNQREALKEFYDLVKLKDNVPSDALRFYPFAEELTVFFRPVRAPEKPRLLSATLLNNLMLLERLFSVPSAQAACGPTYCERPNICFLEGTDPQGGKGGSDFFTPCCYGRICGAPIGCFDLCGNGSKPFIWDPATNICGCGVGGVGGAGSGAEAF